MRVVSYALSRLEEFVKLLFQWLHHWLISYTPSGQIRLHDYKNMMNPRKPNKNKRMDCANHRSWRQLLASIIGAILISVLLLPSGSFNRAWAQTLTPTLTSLNPSTVMAGSEGFTLTVTGANFNRFSVAKWNGVERPTNFLSISQLSVAISESDIALQGIAMIQVFNSNTGSPSNALPFIISGSTTPPPPPPRRPPHR